LNSRKKLSVRKYMGKVYIDIREFFEKDGQTLPTKKGISLTPDLWEKIKKYQNEIDEAIENIK
jgi:predicted transcriptional regulator